jgi:hypothetical protein
LLPARTSSRSRVISNSTVLQRAGEAEQGLVDLIAGLLAGHYLECDMVTVDCAFQDRGASLIQV